MLYYIGRQYMPAARKSNNGQEYFLKQNRYLLECAD